MSLALTLQNSWIAEYLRKTVVNTPYFHLDSWSLIHFCSGVIIGKYVSNWIIAAVLIVLYELFEIIITGLMGFTLAESPTDIVYDIIWGMAGWKYGRTFFAR